MDEFIDTVDGAAAVRAQPITLAEAGLREREHLLEWVLEHPEMLGGSLLVVTSVCDRWVSALGRDRDRLDVPPSIRTGISWSSIPVTAGGRYWLSPARPATVRTCPFEGSPYQSGG